MKMPSEGHRYNWAMLLSLIAAQAPASGLWMVLLMAGSAPVPPSEATQRQTAHLDNFRRLSEESRLVLVGPTMEPGSALRGILLLKAQNQAEVEKEFLSDPYVTQGNLTLTLYPFFPIKGQFTSRPGVAKMLACRLVLMKRKSGASSPGTTEWTRALTNQMSFYARPECPFRLAGTLGEDAEGGFFNVVDTTDPAKASAAGLRAPMVSGNLMTGASSPLFLAEGGMPQVP
jgi:uncharacterized protein YciI